jgi:hypothetical protein
MGDPASLREGSEGALFIVNLYLLIIIVKVFKREALAKFVPAAAVKRIEQVLFIGTRHKGP